MKIKNNRIFFEEGDFNGFPDDANAKESIVQIASDQGILNRLLL